MSKHRHKTSAKLKGLKRYYIHDNGGRPFLVYIDNKKKRVYIYKKPKGTYDNTDKKYYTVLVREFKDVKKVFIGKDLKWGPRFDGNSILLQLKNGKCYVSIGWNIYRFKPKDEIIRYYSIVGNSDVAYPVALGTKNVYFMLDNVYVPRKEFPPETAWAHAYNEYYGHSKLVHKRLDKKRKKMSGYKLLQKRV